MYAKGDGVKQDKAEAIKLLRKAAEQGHADAKLTLGLIQVLGEGANVDE